MPLKQDRIFSLTSLSIYSITIMFYTIVYMVLIVLPIYTHSHQANYITIGWVIGITMLASMVCRPLAGRVIDQYGTGHIFFIALCIFAFSLLGYFSDSIFIYWLVRLTQGAVAACFSTAMEILTIHLFSDRLRAHGLSLYSLTTVIPTVFAPPLGLYLLHNTSLQFLFISFLILAIGNIGCGVWLLKKTKDLEIKRHTRDKQDLKKFFCNQQLLIPTTIMMLASVGNGATFTFLPLYLVSLSSTFAGTYFLLQMLTLVCVRSIGSKFLKSNADFPVVLIGLLIIFVFSSFVIISCYPTQIGLSIAAIANGIAFALLYPSLLTMTSFRIDSIYKAYFLGIFIGGADFGFAMGSVLIGVIAQMISLKIAFFCCAIFALVALPLCFYSKNPSIRF